MKIIETDVWDVASIPDSLGQNISRWAHLKKIWPVESNVVNRLQLNLRLQLVELLKFNEILDPTDFANRKMELCAQVPSDLREDPNIQKILNEVRGIKSVNVISKTRSQKIRDFFKKYL